MPVPAEIVRKIIAGNKERKRKRVLKARKKAKRLARIEHKLNGWSRLSPLP